MEKVKRIIKTLTYSRFSILVFTAFYLLLVSAVYPQEKEIPFRRPQASSIEKSLFEHINEERDKQNLSHLKFSAEISVFARKHSQDMANRSELSHLSSSGETYDERLVEDGFYFMDVGENVAFSETFQADYIHQSLMGSREHRENILTPEFDQVGIGVIYVENKGYYITQDFLQSFQIQETAEIRKLIRERVNDIRRTHALSPLVYIHEADKFAVDYSRRKAENKPKPPFPPGFGETHVISIATPSLPQAAEAFEDVISAFYNAGGLGVWLARNKDFPGGAYFITLLLFPEFRYKNIETNELRQIVVQTINKIRQKMGFEPVSLDNRLSELATQISLVAMSKREKTLNLPPRFNRRNVISYVSDGPYMVPEPIKKHIESMKIKKIGVGIILGKNADYPQGAFWVTVIFNR